jgi:ribosomal protein S18 acetylase RimI-like enzyme
MLKAGNEDKDWIIETLTKSFIDNKSVNYIVTQDAERENRIKALMAYSFEMCRLFGEVYVSDDKKACALILFPDYKKTTLKTLLLDAQLAFSAVGLTNISKAMQREAIINKQHPKGPLYYLWFIGVKPSEQGRGIGSKLLQEIINESVSQKRTICLETSTLKNVPWYNKQGFTVYNQLDFGYPLICMKKD